MSQDVDELFQTERDHNLVFTGCAKTAAEVSQFFFFFFTQPNTLWLFFYFCFSFRDFWMWCKRSKVRQLPSNFGSHYLVLFRIYLCSDATAEV